MSVKYFCDSYLHADDAKLYKIINEQKRCENLELGFSEVLKWSNTYGMRLNFDKRKLTSFGTKFAKTIDFDYKYTGYNNMTGTISNVDSIMDLGIEFDSSLTFESHNK